MKIGLLVSLLVSNIWNETKNIINSLDNVSILKEENTFMKIELTNKHVIKVSFNPDKSESCFLKHFHNKDNLANLESIFQENILDYITSVSKQKLVS